ncbi:MAG: hypothetical protein AAF657_10505 [Acidobacteriota bacterium]
MTNSKRKLFLPAIALALLATSPIGAQQQPDVQELLRQAQSGQLQQMGLQPLQVREGTWSHGVNEGMHVDMLQNETFSDASGIDTDFVAKSSVQLTRIVAGPDLCNPGRQGVKDTRLIAMQLHDGADQPNSHLLVNQEKSRVVLYLLGEVREWKPSRQFCDGEKKMVETTRGDGVVRLEYETQHSAPLNFFGFPRTGDLPEGYAAGLFQWPGGSVDLEVRGPAKGAPAAIATAPVQSGSIADALALARQYSGRDDLPSKEEIEAGLPEGMSLDSMPINMTGQAYAGTSLLGQPEWTLNYTITLEAEGKAVDDDRLVVSR